MLAFLIHYSRAKGSLYFVDCGGVSVKGARIFGRARSSGLLDLASEGTVVFNDVDKLNKALLPRVLQLAINGTYWSKAQKKEARVQSRRPSYASTCRTLFKSPNPLEKL